MTEHEAELIIPDPVLLQAPSGTRGTKDRFIPLY
jgi:hypothetical protein